MNELELINNLPISIGYKEFLLDAIARLNKEDQDSPLYFEEEDEHERMRKFTLSRKKTLLNIVTLFNKNLNDEKVWFIVENAEDLTKPQFYNLLGNFITYRYPEHYHNLDSLWNILFTENVEENLSKIIRFVSTFKDQGPTVLSILLKPDNQDFLFGSYAYNNISVLFSILSSLTSTSLSQYEIQQKIDLIKLHPGEEVSRVMQDNASLNAPTRNFNHIVSYLKRIEYINQNCSEESVLKEFVDDPAHTSLLTIQIDGRPLCQLINQIPGEIFIGQDLWKKLLQCAVTASQDNQNSVEIFKKFFNDVSFEQLQRAIEEALEASRDERSSPQFRAHEKVDVSKVNLLLTAVRNKDVKSTLQWLSENHTILLSKSVFSSALEKKLNDLKPFECIKLAFLATCIQRYTEVMGVSKEPEPESENTFKTGMG